MGVKNSFLGRLLGNADKYSDEQVSQTITLLIEHGVTHGASDIHIEPHERHATVRYRIDGTLKSTHKLPLGALPNVIAEIKRLANMREAEDHLPQEGQYATLVQGDEFEVQIHTLPVVGGEKVVLHILRRLSKPPTLEALGFWGESLHKLQTALSRHHGFILVGAPRRNGNTSTMHSMLQLVNVPALSVATIETAIEYRIPGTSQTVVRPHHGITFHKGLQAALNQDPNIIMLSSIPDKHTAGLAVQAAVGGHMIISGIHANNAPVALAHLRSLSDEPFLLATTVRAVVSQRLVRSLCTHCRERYIPSAEQIADIEKIFSIATAASRKKVHELEQRAAKEGIGNNAHPNTTPSRITALWRANDEGCEACSHSGYQGVVALTEVLVPGEAVQKAVLGHQPAAKIHEAAVKDGFISMELDGLIKAIRGQTTIAEVLRTFSS